MKREQTIVYSLNNANEVKEFLGRKSLIKNRKLYVRTPTGNQESRIGDTLVKNHKGTCYVVRGNPFKTNKKG